MASRSAPAFIILAVLALASGAASQAPAAGPAAAGPAAPDCGAALTSLTGCLTYIQPGSAQSKPPKECCAGVKAAVASPASIDCLCQAFGTNYGIPLNLTRAAGLPAACGANPAAFSKCNIKLPGAPNAAPTEAPSSGSTPATGSPGPSKSAAARSPVSAATLILAALAAPLLSFYYL